MPYNHRLGNITGAVSLNRDRRSHVATHDYHEFALFVVQRRSVNEWIDAAAVPKFATRPRVKCFDYFGPTQHQLFAPTLFNDNWRAPGTGPNRLVHSRF